MAVPATTARYHLPDFTRHLRLNLAIAQMLKGAPEWFREGTQIASVYGCFPPAMWNGGRPMGGVHCDETFIDKVLHAFNDQGIPLRFTFTNPMIREEHLSDPFCNRLMKMADNGLNEVIVFSEVLEQYIRANYPNYKITSSTCKRLTDPEAIIAELNKDYHVVVLDYDVNNKWEILDRLPHPEKIEVLASSPCFPNCQRRSKEYETCGLQQIYYNEHLKKFPNTPFRMSDYSEVTMADFECPAMHRTVFDIVKLPHHISPELIYGEYLPRGINQFKLSGRGGSKLALIELYSYYLFRPEMRDKARFMLLHNLDRMGDIRIDTRV
jgi:hypothetical protein